MTRITGHIPPFNLCTYICLLFSILTHYSTSWDYMTRITEHIPPFILCTYICLLYFYTVQLHHEILWQGLQNIFHHSFYVYILIFYILTQFSYIMRLNVKDHSTLFNNLYFFCLFFFSLLLNIFYCTLQYTYIMRLNDKDYRTLLTILFFYCLFLLTFYSTFFIVFSISHRE